MDPTAFFYWINERHRIWVNRNVFNAPKPWTEDPILRRYRFCNVFRELDTVTKWVDEFIRKPYADHPALWHMLLTARFVNWPETLQSFLEAGCWYSDGDYNPAPMIEVMHSRESFNQQVWTNAYTVSTNGHKMKKPEYILGVVLAEAWAGREVYEKWARTNLRSFCAGIQQVDGVGGFMAYEVACDLRWCPGWLDQASDIYTWANTGPGAKRGLNRIHERPLEKFIREEQAVAEMRQLLDLSPIYLSEWFDRPLEMRDIEHSLCETDKYLRVKNGEGKPRSLYQGEAE